MSPSLSVTIPWNGGIVGARLLGRSNSRVVGEEARLGTRRRWQSQPEFCQDLEICQPPRQSVEQLVAVISQGLCDKIPG
jgi:hypothetical protein